MKRKRPLIWHPTFDAWPLAIVIVIVAALLSMCGELK